jgi:hypothetical protein
VADGLHGILDLDQSNGPSFNTKCQSFDRELR